MNVISINYKNTPLYIRNKMSLSKEETTAFCDQVIQSQLVSECMVLSTCNRTEFYYVGQDTFGLQRAISNFKGFDSNTLMDYYRVYQDIDAIRHLYNVACGIHSMILGEDEILRQVKEALSLAQSIHSSGYLLNTVVKGAISCAKKIKTDTNISKTPISIGTLTANEIFKLDVPSKTVLLIGATGKAGTIVMKNLLANANVNIIATVRNHNHLFDYTSQYPNVTFVDYHQRYEHVNLCDVVVSATSSPHYTIVKNRLLPKLTTDKPRLFLDLAVPQDIDPSIGDVPNATLKNIDYFKAVSKQNNLSKLEEVEKAKLIIDSEIETILKEVSMHDFLPYMDSLSGYVSSHGVESLVFRLKSKSDNQTFESVLKYLKELIV